MTLRTALLSAGAAVALAAPAAAQIDPMDAPDDSWVSISGEVETAGLNEFVLDYGEGLITVDMVDYDWDADAAPMARGHDVTVYGVIDEAFWGSREIEASSVYNADSGEIYYTAVGEDDAWDWGWTGFTWANDDDWDDSAVTVTGMVSSIEAEGEEFFIDQGFHTIEVDTEDMDYDPLDGDGLRDVEIGDRVMITGEIDNDLFDNAELEADSVMVLNDRGY
ncbi:MAG: OB-fold nucleic acid binding domain-containing protein [Oceanicaulis sp.]